MTPDEVMINLEEIFRQKREIEKYDTGIFANKTKQEVEAISAAITQIQDYQKLRERMSVEKIDEIVQNTIEGVVTKNKNVHNEDKFFEVLNEVEIVNGIAQAIVTYLGGGGNE